MSRRRTAPGPTQIVPGSTISVICTGNDSHTRVVFGKVSITSDGRVLISPKHDGFEVRDRRDDTPMPPDFRRDPNIRRSGALGVPKLKTIHAKCPSCSIDFQLQQEKWIELSKKLHANNVKNLDLSKLHV